ncbi:hypothetical protein BJ322DRAFT_1107455 [Thelephora terrestris]|uniref:Uncharacterized protein n=1 Tax=Thelephora terrestris TaxID=56493 RepID=A0A9P6HJP6_9AGAM|nr:hypothetical protein BJ322DRAFT_1107455 [Thelephora terrestris]
MSDFISPDSDSKSPVLFNSIGSADRSGDHTADAPHGSTALDDDEGESSEETGGGTEGVEHHFEHYTGSVAGEFINCAGSINAAVNQTSQTVLVNIRPPNSLAKSYNFKLTFHDTHDSEFCQINVVVSWRYAVYISSLIFVLVLATYTICATAVRFLYDFGNHYESHDDPIAALEQARALIAASDPEVPTTLLKSWKTDNSIGADDRVGHRKPVPPSVHQDQPEAPLLPPSLYGRYDSHEESLPLEHHTTTANSSGEGIQPFKTQGQSHRIDNKAMRDMEYFTNAIQSTIREMSSEFIEALAEMRRSEDMFEDDEDQ